MSTRLARRSLPHRLPAFTALALTALLGTTLAGSFATLVEVAIRADVSAADAETLTVMGAVIGSWSALVVLFAIVSTTGVLVDGRTAEIALLRAAGATPGQVRSLVVTETTVVVGISSLLGAVLAWPGGRVLHTALREAGMVSTSASLTPATAVGATAAVVTGLSVLAAWIGARGASRTSAARLLRGAEELRRPRLAWWRRIAGGVLVAYGAGAGVVTLTVTADAADPYAAMQTAGTAGILVAIGFAAWSPVVLRGLVRPAQVLARRVRFLSPSTRLALDSVGRRAELFGGILGPVIVLTATSVGVGVLTDTDARTLGDAVPDADMIRVLNAVVAAMIAVFAAVLVVNATRATQSRRRAELSRLRLVGADPSQVAGMLRTEMTIVTLIGIGLGLLASCVTTVPFAHARGEGLLADSAWWFVPALVAASASTAVLAHRVAVVALPATRATVTASEALAQARVLADA